MRAAALVLLLAGTASADPLATAIEDVDGDGTVDRIELTGDGVVHVGAAKVKVSASVARGKIVVVRGAGGARLVVDLTTGPHREGIVLARAGRSWRIAARFPLGGIGLDAEYGYELDTSGGAIVRYQTRGGFARCDGKPALLFAERLDGARFKRLDPIPSMVPPGAPSLPARRDPQPAPEPLIFKASAASHRAGASDAGALAIPGELDDGRADTAWREGLASRGEGQFFTFKRRIDGATAHQLRIVPGDARSAATMRAAGRPRTLAIVSPHGAWRVELPDAANDPLGAAYVVDLPASVGDCVTVVVEAAHGTGALAISELELYARDERTAGGAPLLARVIANDTPGAKKAAQTLAALGAAGARAIDAELARTTDPAARRRLVGALARIADPAAATTLVRAATEGWVRDRELIEVIDALAARGQVATMIELAGKPSLPAAARRAAIAHLPPAGDGLDALVALAGRGSRELRRAVIERASGASADDLIRVASGAADAATSGDLWRALTRHLKADPASRPRAVAAMASMLAGVSDYERRYRLVDGIASHGDAPALAALDATLRALPANARGSALRQVAIRALASAPRPAGMTIVLGGARDPDPGVRLAALSAIANAESDAPGAWHAPDGPAALDRVLIGAMADVWPEIRRRAATALGGRCARPGPARALFEAVARDRELDVRGDALAALVQCHAAGVHDLLPFTWDSDRQPIELRVRAVTLVVALEDHDLAAALVGRFTRWRRQALDTRAAELLAVATAPTIGQLRAPGAGDALTAALDDAAFPDIVAAAALGLGALGPECPAAAKAKLSALARAGGPASIEAKHAAALCGRQAR